MFEVDSSLVDASLLLEKVRKNVLHIQQSDLQIKEIFVDRRKIAEPQGNLDLVEKELQSIRKNIQQMNNTWFHKDAEIRNNRKFIGLLIVCIKRCIRKTVYWFARPYVEQQNAFNGAVTRAISDSLKAQEAVLDIINKQ